MDETIARELEEIAGLFERLDRGEWNRAEFRARGAHYGVYTQRQPDRFFVRVRVPLGIISSQQLEALAAALSSCADGQCHLTTRQGLEIHDLTGHQVLLLLRALAEVGLSSHETGGNSVRSVVLCPHAGVGLRECFDATPWAALVSHYFLRHPDVQALPRKFKIGFSCCDDDCARTLVQDLGFQGRTGVQGEQGFRVLVGGGTGSTPALAQELSAFIPATEVLPVTEAFLRVFNRLADRANRQRARVKFMVQELGIERLREETRRELEALERENRTYPAPPELEPGRTLVEPSTSDSTDALSVSVPPEMAAWIATHTEFQTQAGFAAVCLSSVGGTMSRAGLVALAGIAQEFDLTVRLTPEQGLLLRWARVDDLSAIHQSLHEANLLGPQPFSRVMACPGSAGCANAYTDAPAMAQAITARLARTVAAAALGQMAIRVSGCRNGCTLHATADIGLEGVAKRSGDSRSPAYRVWVGGREHDRRPSLAQDLGVVPAHAVPECLEKLAEEYLRTRYPGESLPDVIERTGLAPFLAQVEQFTRPI